jgi:hypothetical protein
MGNVKTQHSHDNTQFLTRVFRELCWARAHLWAAGEISGQHGRWIGYAVDPLQAWAVEKGLVKAIGQDAVQAIMSDAFKDGPHTWEPNNE